MNSNTALSVVQGDNTTYFSYRYYLRKIEENKKGLDSIKRSIDHVTGRFSPVFSLLGKTKSSLRDLVEQEIRIVGEIHTLVGAMTSQCEYEREEIDTYLSLIERRVEHCNEEEQPLQETPLQEPEDNALSRIRHIRAATNAEYAASLRQRNKERKQNAIFYAREGQHVSQLYHSAHDVFSRVHDSIEDEFERLQKVGRAYIGLIELGQAGKLLRASIEDVKRSNETIYGAVRDGFSQIMALFDERKFPYLPDGGTSRLLLPGSKDHLERK